MGFFSENRAEWLLMQIACMSDSITSVPIPVKAAQSTNICGILNETEL
jgi:long-subunit acyl-CoA synthetase (AMP-forming)